MDATGSMGRLFQNAKITVVDMFERASRILETKGYDTNCFSVQFVAYRNYNSEKELLLQASPWESSPNNLRIFLEQVIVSGGMGNEAIEIGLMHANEEAESHDISQVILIGDAPANDDMEITSRRAIRGENYWSKTKFARKTNFKKELEKLKGVKVNTFYLNDKTKENFKEIAEYTGGKCQMLDVYDRINGANNLTNLVTIEILQSIDSSLADEYKKCYIK